MYEDINDVFSKLKEDLFVSGGLTFGVGPAGSPVTVDAGVSGSYASSPVNELRKYNEKVLTYNVCVARYPTV